MPRPSLLQLLLALFAGLVLLGLAIFSMNFLAKLPTPIMLQALLQNKNLIELTLHSVLLLHIPLAILSGIFSFAVFKLQRTHNLSIALCLLTPWLIYCIVDAISYYQASQLSPLHKVFLIFAWYKWFGRLSVPFGVWATRKSY